MTDKQRFVQELSILRNPYGFDKDTIHRAQLEVCDEVEKLRKQRDELLKHLRIAVRQNEHDMLMTGEELRAANAAIAKVKGQP